MAKTKKSKFVMLPSGLRGNAGRKRRTLAGEFGREWCPSSGRVCLGVGIGEGGGLEVSGNGPGGCWGTGVEVRAGDTGGVSALGIA